MLPTVQIPADAAMVTLSMQLRHCACIKRPQGKGAGCKRNAQLRPESHVHNIQVLGAMLAERAADRGHGYGPELGEPEALRWKGALDSGAFMLMKRWTKRRVRTFDKQLQ